MFKYLLLFFFSCTFSFSQTLIDSLESKFLNDTRKIKIQLPKNYDVNSNKRYPLIVVLDGDYMFDAVSGNSNYLSYWGDIPESIVVGINQISTRYDDCNVLDNIDFVPIASSAKFYDFINNEIIDYFDNNFRLTKFRVIVGHESTANFINYFLLNNDVNFSGYIAISPKFSYNMENYLTDRFNKIKKNIIYYLSTSDKDFKSIYERSKDFYTNYNQDRKSQVKLKFDEFKGYTHYNLPAHSISNALEHIFEFYSPINSIEYDEKLKKIDYSPVKYLTNKYQTIKDYYGIEKKMLVNDIRSIEKYIEEIQQYKYYEDLSDLAINKYPKTILGSYYMGLYHERTGDPRKAMHIYRSAYTLEDIDGITKDELLEKADLISNDLNY